ncbi:MAG TPA: tetratricopeptide repeat protein [Pyrinomonadaceae bacterium]
MHRRKGRVAGLLFTTTLVAVTVSAQPIGESRKHVTPAKTRLEKANKRSSPSNSKEAQLTSRVSYDKLLAVAGDDPVRLNNLALRLTLEGRHDKAAEVMEKVVGLRPKNLQLLVNLATVYLNSSEYERALELLRRASAIDPNDMRIQHLMCDLLAQTKRHIEAVPCFERRLTTEKLDAVSTLNFSVSLVELGELDTALLHLKDAYARYPTDVALLNNYALALYRDGQYSESSRLLKKLVRLRPKVGEYKFNLAITMLASKNRKGALEQYAVLKTSDPDLARRLYVVLFSDSVVDARRPTN